MNPQALLNPGNLWAIVVGLLLVGIPMVAIITEHFQKMARIKADARSKADRDVIAAVDGLRKELTELRDTTTRYDLSFDTALQRLEARVAALERQGLPAPQASVARSMDP